MDAERLALVAHALEDGDERPVLERLLVTCVELLAMSGAGIAVIDQGEHRGAVAISAPHYALVDELQFSLGEGPCLDADRAGHPILEPDLLDAIGQWPAFAPAAIGLAVRAVFAFPLRVGAVRIGVLTFYREAPGDLDDVDARDAITLALVITHLLLDVEEAAGAGTVPIRLSEVMGHRAHVHQATGMIAAQLDVDVGAALAELRVYAWSRDRTIDSVARDVVGRVLRFGAEP